MGTDERVVAVVQRYAHEENAPDAVKQREAMLARLMRDEPVVPTRANGGTKQAMETSIDEIGKEVLGEDGQEIFQYRALQAYGIVKFCDVRSCLFPSASSAAELFGTPRAGPPTSVRAAYGNTRRPR